MKEVILAKCGELVLKGLNRSNFENILMNNIKQKLKDDLKSIRSAQSTVYIELNEGADPDLVVEKLTKVFGISSISRAGIFEKDIEKIKKGACEYLRDELTLAKTFKVESKRSDKKFPLKSPEISAITGGEILKNFRHLKVDVNNPDIVVTVEIRDNNAFVHGARIKGAGGMPTSSNGKAAVLISGGIDSPVAAYMMAKRGLSLDAIHFFSSPYASEKAKEKVIELTRIISGYAGKINLHIVPFTQQQLEIKKMCKNEHMTLIMRRMMMQIAERIAKKNRCDGLITGESLGQVASQTLLALAVTGECVKMPILRPLVGMDKEEIVTIARKIGTFETSILPYEDCCTVFVPKHPTTKPKLSSILESESKIDMEYWIQKAVDETYVIEVSE